MPSLVVLLQLLVSGCLCVVVHAAEPVLSKERVVMTTTYGDIQVAFFPEVRAFRHAVVSCLDGATGHLLACCSACAPCMFSCGIYSTINKALHVQGWVQVHPKWHQWGEVSMRSTQTAYVHLIVQLHKERW